MLFIIYAVLGYWATGVVLYENKVIITTWSNLFTRKVLYGILLGWLFIPIAIIKRLAGK
ncbi:MAG: cystinosin-like protein [Lachnospiraceae bacterium]|nr:cystinosin-like protein [Lachnospiraceae bacterium]